MPPGLSFPRICRAILIVPKNLAKVGVKMYLLLFCLWLTLNGSVTWEIVLFGVFITAALGYLAFLLFGYTPKKDLRFLKRIPLFLIYVPVLIFEIIRANVAVMGLILSRKKQAKKSLVVFDTDLKTKFGQYMLANSITLTPGTITVRVENGRFTVHCLNRDSIEGITEGLLYRLVKRMEA